jgi:hypothetical protein
MTKQTAPNIKPITTMPFPTWDGNPTTMPNYIEQLHTLKQDPFFSSADRAMVLSSFEPQSTWLCQAILASLPPKELHIFHNQPSFSHKGFAMFSKLLR